MKSTFFWNFFLGTAKLDLDWKRLPQELAPPSIRNKGKKRKTTSTATPNKVKRKTVGDISKHLDKLEANEKEGGEDEGGGGGKSRTGGGGGAGSDVDDSDADKEDENANSDIDQDEIDEEMDEDGDYANNYFDNGEGYLDEEDDNLDEGGIYWINVIHFYYINHSFFNETLFCFELRPFIYQAF